MSQLELTQARGPGSQARHGDRLAIETDQIVARAETGRCSVLYLGSGEKVFVQEGLAEIERRIRCARTRAKVAKRFKREMRERKALGMSVERAFAALWEEVSIQETLPEREQSDLFQEMLAWTKRWLM